MTLFTILSPLSCFYSRFLAFIHSLSLTHVRIHARVQSRKWTKTTDERTVTGIFIFFTQHLHTFCCGVWRSRVLTKTSTIDQEIKICDTLVPSPRAEKSKHVFQPSSFQTSNNNKNEKHLNFVDKKLEIVF